MREARGDPPSAYSEASTALKNGIPPLDFVAGYSCHADCVHGQGHHGVPRHGKKGKRRHPQALRRKRSPCECDCLFCFPGWLGSTNDTISDGYFVDSLKEIVDQIREQEERKLKLIEELLIEKKGYLDDHKAGRLELTDSVR